MFEVTFVSNKFMTKYYNIRLCKNYTKVTRGGAVDAVHAVDEVNAVDAVMQWMSWMQWMQ